MKICGIEFVPLDEPLERRIQTLAAGATFVLCVLGSPLLSIYLMYLLFTPFWWLSLVLWCWVYLDRHACETGGRPSSWVQNWAWWRYTKNYYPARLKIVPDFTLDRKKNYLFCCYPHGVLPIGVFSTIALESGDFHQIHPEFQIRTSTLPLLFYLPFGRELGLRLGGVSCSAKSLQYLLGTPGGGYIVNLFPGGAAEAMYSKPGKYTFIVKKRRGFIKVALKTGASLVPVISFGETDQFGQIHTPLIRKIQDFMKRWVGFTPVLIIGRGFLQYSFGLIPRRNPITTVGKSTKKENIINFSKIDVVGMPIEVPAIENPTDEQIGEVQRRFSEELVNLFEKYKHEHHIHDLDNVSLNIL